MPLLGGFFIYIHFLLCSLIKSIIFTYMEKMKLEFVFSRIHDENIRKGVMNLQNSPIWKECNHRDELDDVAGYWLYYINFKGLIPVQVTNIQQY